MEPDGRRQYRVLTTRQFVGLIFEVVLILVSYGVEFLVLSVKV